MSDASAEARLREALTTVEDLIRRDSACFNLSDELQSVRSVLRETLSAHPHASDCSLAGASTGQLFTALLRRIDFDGMDPRSFSLGELYNAIQGAEWPE